MKKKNSTVSTIILLLILLVGVGFFCYPFVSNWWNSRVQSDAIASYKEAVASMSEEDLAVYFIAADDYNEKLRQIGSLAALSNPNLLEGYEDILNIAEDGIMGYLTIDKIGVELPIRHGTSDGVLSRGAGHLEGSSFPVGGKGTHAVISAHRGLPSSRLFTDLDAMEAGDYFRITVPGRELWYVVDSIDVVLPDEIESIYIRDGADYVTLMTCTPYGINTHRLLVRGRRTDPPEEPIETKVRNWRMIVWIAAAFVLLLIIAGIAICCVRKRRGGNL